MHENIKPNEAEKEFLTISFNRFHDLFEEMMLDGFFERDGWYRLSRIKEVFSVYVELLNYEPIKWTIDNMKEARPPRPPWPISRTRWSNPSKA